MFADVNIAIQDMETENILVVEKSATVQIEKYNPESVLIRFERHFDGEMKPLKEKEKMSVSSELKDMTETINQEIIPAIQILYDKADQNKAAKTKS